jgi:4'-phosphopantetheinyl transferase
VSGIQTSEIWGVDLAAAKSALQTIEQRTPRLCPADRARALSLSDPNVRDEWLATHIALRLLIERAAGAQWRGATFTRAERGKPHLYGAPLAFSLSHAPGLALIGLAPHGSIGVDVERTRRVRVGEARRTRIEEAGAALHAAPLPYEGEARFLQAWVRLEAFAKAEGCGIGRLLTRLGILGTSAAERTEQQSARELAGAMLSGSPSPAVRDLQLGEGVYAAAVFAGAPLTSDVTRLPASVEGLEKLTG